MFSKYLLYLVLITFTSTGAIPRRLNPQCRSNACDDRPQCPKTSCRCIFPSRMDCAVYYQCVNGKPFQYRCSPGLLFNNETLSCDYSYNVKCNISTSAPTSSEAITTTSASYTSTTETATVSDVTEKETTVTNKITKNTVSVLPPETFKTDATDMYPSTHSEETDVPLTSEIASESTTTEISQKQTSVSTDTETESTTFRTTLNISISPAPSESISTELIEDITTDKITSESVRESTSTQQTTLEPQTSSSKNIITEITDKYSSDHTGETSTLLSSKTISDMITTTKLLSTKNNEKSTNSTTITTETNVVTSTESPISEFLCPSRFGLYADPKSCKRFYHCSHWKPYHKWCPSDLHFNPKLRVCDWPYRAGCDIILPTSEQENSTPATLVPSNTNITCDCDICELPTVAECTAYILCVNKVGIKMYCSPGLYFNRMTGTCDLEENVECYEDNIDCSKYPGRYLLEGSCSYFVECRNGKKTVRTCPEGLQFNKSSEMCTWFGSCAGLPDNVPTSKTLVDIALCNGCEYCFKPVLNDCTRFVRCFKDLAIEERCSSGLFFNSDTEMCDHDYNVQCPTPQPNPECPERFGYFPYPGECGMYLQCVNGNATVKTCPGVLHFNPVKKHCDYPWAAGCNDSESRPTPEPSQGIADCDCDCCLKPVSTDCRNFTICINQVGYSGSCSSGLLFNSHTENCDFAENVECTTAPEKPTYSCPEYQGLFPHPDDCKKFIHCAHGFPYVKDCPSNLHFNPKLKVCDWPYAAGCQADPTTDPTTDDDDRDLPCDICSSCFIPDESDCASYMYCQNGTGYRLRCSGNLVFNPDTETCDVANNVKCPSQPASKCPKPDGLFPAKECSQFIHCSNGIAYLKDCPDGLHFNAQILVCDWPENVKCDEMPIVPTLPPKDDDDIHVSNRSCSCDCCFLPHDKDCSKYILCLDGHMHFGQCSRGLLFNPGIQNCDLAERVTCGGISSLCFEPNGLFPNPEICSSYIRCSDGNANVEYCHNGMHFSAKERQCLDPCKAQCDHNYNCESSSTSPSTTPRIPSSTLSPFCPERDGLFSNKNDCSSFYQCSAGRAFFVRCPPGLHFDEKYGICDYPCNAKCDPNVVCDSSSTSSTTPHTLSSTTLSPFCPERDGLFVNKQDCSSFYQCSDGKAFLVQCPSGLHFDEKYKICDYPCNAKCNATIDCSTSSSTSSTMAIPSTTQSPYCSEKDGLFPNVDDCALFYQCSGGKAYVVACPPGLHFSNEHKVCEYPCEAKCNKTINCNTTSSTSSTISPVNFTTTQSPFCPEKDGLFPNADNCSLFYQCSEGRAYSVACPSGLHFSKEHEVCEYPCAAKCNTTIICDSTSSSSTTSVTTTTSTPSPFCPEKDGLFPNEDNCASFYQCSEGKAHLVACPSGLHFSKEHKVCEYPCDAKCDTSIDCDSVSSSSTTSVTTTTSTPSPFCPEEDGLFPNEDNCASFYQCSDGKAHLVACPSGLHFSKEHKVCEYPCDAKCDTSMDCSPVTVKPTSSSGSANCPFPDGLYPVVGDCTAFYLCSNNKDYLIPCPPGLHFSVKLETCETPCVAECNTSLNCGSTVEPTTSTVHPLSPECKQPDGLFQNPDDCGTFYQCSGGRATLLQCPSGLHFSLEDSACEKPCVAGCDLNIECPPEIPETKGNCTCNGCYLPDPNDCSAFYYCENGHLSKSYCPFGTLFSKTSSVCEDENNVDCENNGDPGMCPEPYGFFPYPGDCKKFIHCDNGVAHVKKCQGDLEYDPLHRVCTEPKGYCGEIILDPNCPEPTGMFPDSKNCSLFYHCEHGVAYPKRCSPPLMFNPENKVCDWPNNVNCGKENVSTTTPTSETTKPAIKNTTTSTMTSTITPTPTTNECYEVPGVICPCACRVPTYDECSSYFQCQEDGTACKKFCPEGLYFNKREMVCDLPENVECRDFFFSSIRRAKLFSHRLTP